TRGRWRSCWCRRASSRRRAPNSGGSDRARKVFRRVTRGEPSGSRASFAFTHDFGGRANPIPVTDGKCRGDGGGRRARSLPARPKGVYKGGKITWGGNGAGGGPSSGRVGPPEANPQWGPCRPIPARTV